MIKETVYHGGGNSMTDFRPQKPQVTVPVITRKKKIAGVLYYFTEDGRQFIASTFDKMFTPAKGTVQTKGFVKGHKGDNPCYKLR